MTDKDNAHKHIIWEIASIRQFGPSESSIIVQGLKAKINGLEWHICRSKPTRKNGSIHNPNEKYYLTNIKRTHLSFHPSIDAAQRMAYQGGFNYVRK